MQLIAIGIAMILHAMHSSGAGAEPDIEDPEVVLADPLLIGQSSSFQPVSFLPPRVNHTADLLVHGRVGENEVS